MPPRQQPRQQASCCSCCFSLVLSLSFSIFIYWLTLRVSITSPVCSIEEFDAYALNKTANNATKVNHTIHYDLKLNNKNKDKGIYYDDVNVAFYYLPNASSFPIGNATYPAFYQGHGKSTHRVASIEPPEPFWDSAGAAVRSNGSAMFRVELVTSVRYKNLMFKSKRHHVKVATNEVQVNDEGKLVKKKKKGVKLTSGSGKIKSCFNVLGFFIVLVFLHLW